VASIPPLAAILRELVGPETEVRSLLPPGVSAHAYEPRPSEVKGVEEARRVFIIDSSFDGWAIPSRTHAAVSVLGFLPPERLLAARTEAIEPDRPAPGPAIPLTVEAADPHFWLDPAAVRAALPSFIETLIQADPEAEAALRAGFERFDRELEALEAETRSLLEPLKGRPVVLFHSAFVYLLEPYGLEVIGLVEPLPGKEPTARDLQRLAASIRRRGVRVIFTEPQLPARPAQVLAEASGARLVELDPLGGGPGRGSYAELIRHNVRMIRGAFQ